MYLFIMYIIYYNIYIDMKVWTMKQITHLHQLYNTIKCFLKLSYRYASFDLWTYKYTETVLFSNYFWCSLLFISSYVISGWFYIILHCKVNIWLIIVYFTVIDNSYFKIFTYTSDVKFIKFTYNIIYLLRTLSQDVSVKCIPTLVFVRYPVIASRHECLILYT